MTTAIAKQARLPGTEGPEIEELEEAAFKYAEIRDQRMELTQREVSAKQTVLALMKKHKKNDYNHAGVEIEVVLEVETVKVRIKKEKEEDAEASV